jgi:predicted nucleic acid-binding protein
MTNQILVDSNILIYAINTSSPKNKTARDFLKKASKESKLCLSQQNITETLRILTHKKFPNPWPMKEAVNEIAKMADSVTIISPNTKTLFYFFEILKKTKVTSSQVFDAYLAATMLSNGIERIATDNQKDFSIFEEIKVINPFIK